MHLLKEWPRCTYDLLLWPFWLLWTFWLLWRFCFGNIFPCIGPVWKLRCLCSYSPLTTTYRPPLQVLCVVYESKLVLNCPSKVFQHIVRFENSGFLTVSCINIRTLKRKVSFNDSFFSWYFLDLSPSSLLLHIVRRSKSYVLIWKQVSFELSVKGVWRH